MAVARTRRAQDKLPTYRLADTELGMGASFGNDAIWINTKNTGAIERVFCIDHGQSAIGSIATRYAMSGNPAKATWDSNIHDAAAPYVALRPDGPLRHFELHPAYQRCTFTVANAVHIAETTFVPLSEAPASGDAPVVYQIIELENRHDRDHELRIMGFARLRGSLPEDVCVRYDQETHALAAWNRNTPGTARFFGFDVEPTAYETSFDFGSAYDPSHAHGLGNSTEAQGDVLGGVQIDVLLKAGASFRVTLRAAAYADRVDSARQKYAALAPSALALERTIDHLEDVLQRSRLLSPDAVLNDGALWSKVNMRRVMARYPQGVAFTNDPGNSSNVVIRDAAWFVYGNDHFMPEFSRALLDKLVEVQYPSGKLPEYFDAIDGRIEDDGLNINDDTPLFILAANHHFRSTGDLQWMHDRYPAIARAARYIMSQRDDRGLVFCDARDPRGYVWAIASWRNIIDGYTINGAVTEINAECVAALRAAGHLADESGHADEGTEFRACSNDLRDAMDRHLINPENGLYYLNIDADGNKHSDVTGDLIFPVMFRACDEETGFRIISRLNSPDFATPAGIRTASRNDPRYDPAAYAGLLGGVWPGLTWWYAFAAARYHPDAMVNALRSSFEHYSVSPRKNATVPGQFSEWFDGESLVNKGMRLSPWEPPRFLWAAVEGICGLSLTTGLPKINPIIPKYWRWVALRNVPYHGTTLSYVVTRQQEELHIYTTGDVESSSVRHRFDEDVSHKVTALSPTAPVIALRRGSDFTIVLGSAGAQTANVPLVLGELLDVDTIYELRVYNSERDAWEDGGSQRGATLCSLALSIESRGFRIISLTAS